MESETIDLEEDGPSNSLEMFKAKTCGRRIDFGKIVPMSGLWDEEHTFKVTVSTRPYDPGEKLIDQCATRKGWKRGGAVENVVHRLENVEFFKVYYSEPGANGDEWFRRGFQEMDKASRYITLLMDETYGEQHRKIRTVVITTSLLQLEGSKVIQRVMEYRSLDVN